MKKGLHPPFYNDAKTTCTMCGAVYPIPDTVADQKVESCRSCHPVYTGKERKEAKGGRIERFKKRLRKSKE